MPSPPPQGRRSEWPRASTNAATAWGGGAASVATGAAGAKGRSGASTAALLPPSGRASMGGQKASSGGNPAAARRLRTCHRQVALTLQCRCALRRRMSVGSPLNWLPLTRFTGRGKRGLFRNPNRQRPRPTPRRNFPSLSPRLSGPLGNPLPWRGRRRPCRAGRTHWWSRPAAGARRMVPCPEDGTRGYPPVSLRRIGFAQTASVGPHFGGMGWALSRQVPQVATERAGLPPPGWGARPGRAARCPAAWRGGRARGIPLRAVRVWDNGARTREHPGVWRQGAEPTALPRLDGVQLCPPAPRGLLFPA